MVWSLPTTLTVLSFALIALIALIAEAGVLPGDIESEDIMGGVGLWLAKMVLHLRSSG